MEPIKKTFKAKVNGVDKDKFIARVILSDETKDSYGEVILAKGWVLDRYKKHPVLLSSHSYNDLRKNIGKVDIFIKGKELRGDVTYFVGQGNEEADWAWKLVSEYGIAAYSVGFIPLKMIEKDELDEEDINKYELDYKDLPRRVYIKQELVENSQVVVPANPNSLQDSLDSSDPIIRSMALDIKSRGVLEGSNKEEVNKEDEIQCIIPFKSYSLLNKDIPWDSVKAKDNLWEWAKNNDKIDFKKYSQGFAYHNGDILEILSSYEVLHHDIENNEIKTNYKGIITAMATLLSDICAIDIPEDKKKDVYEHLSKHYEEFSEKVPEFRVYNEKELEDIFHLTIDEIKQLKGEKQNDKDIDVTMSFDSIPLTINGLESNGFINEQGGRLGWGIYKTNEQLSSVDFEEAIVLIATAIDKMNSKLDYLVSEFKDIPEDELIKEPIEQMQGISEEGVDKILKELNDITKIDNNFIKESYVSKILSAVNNFSK